MEPSMQIVETDLGPVRVRGAGTGPPVVFVHGILVGSRLWEPAADLVVPYGQTVLVDLPLGTHAAPVPDRSKLTLGGVASALLQVIDAVFTPCEVFNTRRLVF